MEIKFIGPLGKVTGSCTWMRDRKRGWNFLIDCGMQQGELTASEWNACKWEFVPEQLNFVVLTHAHIDHSGLLPVLYKQGFRGFVYCTVETKEIATELLKDAAGFPEALFTKCDVDKIKWKEPGSEPLLGFHHPVDQDLFLRFFRTGHVMGAVSVAVCWGAKGEGQKSIIFSGDVGPGGEDAEYLPFLRHRMAAGQFDYAVIESTYGGTNRSVDETDPDARRARLRSWLKRAIEKSGVLIIPAFALGRTQDVMFDLHWIVAESPEEFRDIRFFLDSPAATRLHPIFLRGLERAQSSRQGKVRPLWLGKQMFRWFDLSDSDPLHRCRVQDICRMTLGAEQKQPVSSDQGNAIARAWRPIFQKVQDRKRLFEQGLTGPSVLVVGSGTCDGGAAAYWLPRLLGSELNAVLMTGYSASSTIAGRLLSLKLASLEERQKHNGLLSWSVDNTVPIADIRADIDSLSGYSAHADQSGLIQWIFSYHQERLQVAGKTIFIQHGVDGQRLALERALKARAFQESVELSVVRPDAGHAWMDLDAGATAIDQSLRKQELERELALIQQQLSEMMPAM